MSGGGGSRVILGRELRSLLRREGQSISDCIVVNGPVENDLLRWSVLLIGPEGTMYEKGVFPCVVRFPKDYPMSPPSVQFTPPIFHPNVYECDGKVCLSTLQLPNEDVRADSAESGLYWRPIIGAEGALMSVISLLSDPNVDDPANPRAAALLSKRPSQFEARCLQDVAASKARLPDGFQYPRAPSNPQSSQPLDSLADSPSGGDVSGEEIEYVYSSEDEESELDVANAQDV